MIFKRYISEGLAHYSYLIADQGQATVIDPRRDIDDYLRDAANEGCHIHHVLETHRNEDYLIGSLELEAATGAVLFHADSQWDYQYGTAVQEGQVWQTGRLKIEAIHTPGHTPGSMSYLLCDPEGNPWMIFTGDLLFSGDVGRMDLLGEDRLSEMAGLLYDSLFNKVLPLGDSIIVCPAHGMGSVCGAEISERTWTTIGLEKQHNPKLKVGSKEEFIAKHAKILERPPYFRNMERLNLEGPPVLGRLPVLRPFQPTAFAEAAKSAQVVDTRGQVSFAAAYVPDSLSIWKARLSNYAGWFLQVDQPILFVCDPADTEEIVRKMVRLVFDNLAGYLEGGIVGWTKAGKTFKSIALLTMKAFCDLMQSDTEKLLLDIRGEDELKGAGLQHGKHIHLTQMPGNLEDLPVDLPIIPLCTSGNRSMIAASILSKAGWEDVRVPVGGLGAWRASGCDFEL